MPYIVVNVMGRVGAGGNGSLWVDGFPHSHIKNGEVIYVSEGYHSVKYVPTLKKTEWTTSANFTYSTVMTANVVDEDFSSPDFRTHIADTDELTELENKRQSDMKSEASYEKKSGGWYALRCVIGIVIVLVGLYVTFKFKQTGWEECILPSVLIGIGAGFIKSINLGSAYGIDKGGIAKGFFGWGIGWFVVMVVFNFIGKLFS